MNLTVLGRFLKQEFFSSWENSFHFTSFYFKHRHMQPLFTSLRSTSVQKHLFLAWRVLWLYWLCLVGLRCVKTGKSFVTVCHGCVEIREAVLASRKTKRSNRDVTWQHAPPGLQVGHRGVCVYVRLACSVAICKATRALAKVCTDTHAHTGSHLHASICTHPCCCNLSKCGSGHV